jgi:hypothetical protein
LSVKTSQRVPAAVPTSPVKLGWVMAATAPLSLA